MALDGLLDAAEKKRLERHLAKCEVCRSEWEAMRQVATLFEGAPTVGPPLGFAIRVERRLEQKVQKRRRAFGGLAVLTSSLSLAGVTVAAVVLIVVGLVSWQWLGSLPAVQQGTSAVSQVASGMGMVGKGASLFLGDLLLRFGPPLIVLIGIGLVVLAGLWTWLYIKRPGSHRNGYV
jgi:anti-sigma factor RsiW